MPQGENASAPKVPPKAPVGVALNFKNAGLGGEWTVQHQDGWIVTIGQMAGDGMTTRTLDLRNPKDAAGLEAVKVDPGNRSALRAAGRKQALAYEQQITFSDAFGQVVVKGFDGRSRKYLVSGMLNGQEINQWIDEDVARGVRNTMSGAGFLERVKPTEKQETKKQKKDRSEPSVQSSQSSTTPATNVPKTEPVITPQETQTASPQISSNDTPRQARQELRERREATKNAQPNRGRPDLKQDTPQQDTPRTTANAPAFDTQAINQASTITPGQTIGQPLRASPVQATTGTRGSQSSQGFSSQKTIRQAENKRQQLKERKKDLDQRAKSLEQRRQALTQAISQNARSQSFGQSAKPVVQLHAQLLNQRRGLDREQQDLQLARMDHRRQSEQLEHVLANPTPEVLQTWAKTQPAMDEEEFVTMIQPPPEAKKVSMGIRLPPQIGRGMARVPKPSFMSKLVRPVLVMAALGGAQQSARVAQGQTGLRDDRQAAVGEGGDKTRRAGAPPIASAAPDLVGSYASKTESDEQRKFKKSQQQMGETRNLLLPAEPEDQTREEDTSSIQVAHDYQEELDQAGIFRQAQLSDQQELDEESENESTESDQSSDVEPSRQSEPPKKTKLSRLAMHMLDLEQSSTFWLILPFISMLTIRNMRMPFIHRKLPEEIREFFPPSGAVGVTITISLDMFVFIVLMVPILFLAIIMAPALSVIKAVIG
ncbi:hypothetical protein FJZ48_02970 [Candidatus Uhrbacteria bacterium]|nr:hypothetical protein [Candidatus Uhrbacteria bacterium]